ncbi:unnamed protein product [Blepharisma stoltei]|uniref:Uncharacterized protein n=1 Tax=Blepharisma stoltei TaxID=1481888 RepID=A0AAU9IN54_9CILI|nr:unnamed protein product [Blepharisma stoltei]
METLIIERPSENVALVRLNRPNKRNAMNGTMLDEIARTMSQLSEDPDVRCIVIAGNGKCFTAGIDINYLKDLFETHQGADPARSGIIARPNIKAMQEKISSLEKCSKPVIVAVHGLCIGAGVDFITAADIRYCTTDTIISVREINIGMAADIGTLQRLHKVVGNQSWARDLMFSGRDVKAAEATSHGLFSKCFESKEKVLEEALKLANEIASKSPVAIVGIKKNLIYSRDHSVEEGLEFILNWNSFALQTEDTVQAIFSAMQNTKAVFPKL